MEVKKYHTKKKKNDISQIKGVEIMRDKFLNIKIEQARKEHQEISKAILENDREYLLLKYGSLKNANERLLELEYFLNYKEWK